MTDTVQSAASFMTGTSSSDTLLTLDFADGRATAFTSLRGIGRDAGLLCPALGLEPSRFARPHQVHLTSVLQVSEEFFSLSPATQAMLLRDKDAIIYDVRHACLGISTADCIPVVCYDPIHHCAAAIHAGWRGTQQRIVREALHHMTLAYSTRPQDLLCLIGPGISLSSFEVGDEVYEAFAAADFPMDEMAMRMPVKNPDGSLKELKWHIDLKLCNKMQLIAMGVDENNIIVSDIDSMTDTRCFSARREGAATGRMLSGIVLR